MWEKCDKCKRDLKGTEKKEDKPEHQINICPDCFFWLGSLIMRKITEEGKYFSINSLNEDEHNNVIRPLDFIQDKMNE